MWETQIRPLVREDPTRHGATKPMRNNYWVCALEPGGCTCWSPHPLGAAPVEVHVLWGLHLVKSMSSGGCTCWSPRPLGAGPSEVHVLWSPYSATREATPMGSLCIATRKSSPYSPQLEQIPHSNGDPEQPKIIFKKMAYSRSMGVGFFGWIIS